MSDSDSDLPDEEPPPPLFMPPASPPSSPPPPIMPEGQGEGATPEVGEDNDEFQAIMKASLIAPPPQIIAMQPTEMSASMFFQGLKGAEQTLADDTALFSVTPALSARAMAEDLVRCAGTRAIRVVDGTACVGGNSVAFSRSFSGGVEAIEFDENRARLLQHNLKALKSSLQAPIRTHQDSCLRKASELSGQIYFLDPPWGGRGAHKKKLQMDMEIGGKALWDCVTPDLLPKECIMLAIKAPPRWDLLKFRRRTAKHWAWRWSGAYMDDKIMMHVFSRVAPSESGKHLKRVITRNGWVRRGMTKAQLRRAVDVMVDWCLRSQLETGDAAGHWAASSIGETATQKTLHSIHNSGGTNRLHGKTGISRANEILACSQPSLAQSVLTPVPGVRVPERKQQSVASVPLNRILKSFYLLHDPIRSEPPFTLHEPDRLTCEISAMVHGPETLIHDVAVGTAGSTLKPNSGAGGGAGGPAGLVPSEWVVRLQLDSNVGRDRGITPEMVAQRMLHLPHSRKIKLQHATVIYAGPTSPVPVIRLRPWGEPGSEYLTEKFGNNLVMLCEQHLEVGGIRHILEVQQGSESQWIVKKDGSLATKDCMVLNTQGSSLTALTQRSWLDWYNCRTTDTAEILRVLGIMACRKVTHREIRRVFVGSTKMSPVDERHFRLLTYAMTSRGHFVVTSRFGLQHEPTDALNRLTFEQPWNVATEAAIHGHQDNLSSQQSALLTNSKAPVGTGMVGIIAEQVGKSKTKYAQAAFGHLLQTSQLTKIRKNQALNASRRAQALGLDPQASVKSAKEQLELERKFWPAAPSVIDAQVVEELGAKRKSRSWQQQQEKDQASSSEDEKEEQNDEDAGVLEEARRIMESLREKLEMCEAK